MQDLKITNLQGAKLIREEAPAGHLPPEFLARLADSEAVIIVQKTEAGGLALVPVLPGGQYQPEHIATHALVEAIIEALPQLVRRVSGYPTHADRYLAFQEFAMLERENLTRYEIVNTMLMQFEDSNLKPGDLPTRDYMDSAADFLVHAMAETEPKLQAPTVNPT